MEGKTKESQSEEESDEEGEQRWEVEDEADANVEPAGFFDIVSFISLW